MTRSQHLWAEVFSAEQFWEQLEPSSLQSILHSMPGIRFFVKDLRGVYIFASRPMYLAHGFDQPAGVVGHADHEFIPRYLADRYVADDRRVFDGGNVFGRVELVTRHKGFPDWYVTSKTALRTRNGEIFGLIGVSKQIEEARGVAIGSPALTLAVDYIRNHYASSFELDLLARYANLSPRGLSRHFKETFGVAPMQYVRQLRVGKACQLLVETGDTLATIAAATGFCDQSHMNREFTRSIGTTPGNYRLRYRA